LSRSYEYSYALEAARRRQIYLNRISSTTEQFYSRYMEQYTRMKRDGFATYIPSEMNRLESDLSRLRAMLISDPEEARELSYTVGSYIRSMSSLASAAREQFDRAERLRAENLRLEREQHQNELVQAYFEILKSINNPIVVNYSASDLQALKKEIDAGTLTDKSELVTRAKAITANAEKKANEWKSQTISRNRQANAIEVINDAETRLRSKSIENKEKTQQFLDRINQLRSGLAEGKVDAETVEKQITALETEVDDTLISEETRRETVKAIIKQLRTQEFTVEKPQVVQTDGKNYVKIVAKQPSGKRAICNIDLHGKIAYKFDNYEGMTCLKDIEKFNIDLQQVYSVKLSDERVLWSNPDKLDKDATSTPRTDRRGK